MKGIGEVDLGEVVLPVHTLEHRLDIRCCTRRLLESGIHGDSVVAAYPWLAVRLHQITFSLPRSVSDTADSADHRENIRADIQPSSLSHLQPTLPSTTDPTTPSTPPAQPDDTTLDLAPEPHPTLSASPEPVLRRSTRTRRPPARYPDSSDGKELTGSR